MANIPITVGGLFQGGRVRSAETQVEKTYLSYSAIVDTDTLQFQFPTAADTNLTFGVPQSMFVDNADNDYEMRVSVSATGQSFAIPANSTGMYTVDAIAGSVIEVVSGGVADDKVYLTFYNYPRTPYVYYAYGANVSVASVPNGADVALGSTTDAPQTNPFTAATLISVAKGMLTFLSNLSTYLAPFSYRNITTSTTTVVKAAAGVVGGVTVNTAGGAGSIIIYDNTAGSGTIIATFNSAVAGTYQFPNTGITAGTGITVVTTGAPNITVSYR